MFRKLIQKGAVKSWQKEASTFVDQFMQQAPETRADFFIYGTRTKAGLQIEGHFILPDGMAYKGPDIIAYPLMVAWLDRIINNFNKQGAYTEAGCVSIWRYTALSFLYPELEPIVERLWASILETKHLWRDAIEHHYQTDINEGLDPNNLKLTYGLVVEILKTSPPQKVE